MKLLITGSSGKIGSELSRYLRRKGIQIVEYSIENGDDVLSISNQKEMISCCEGVLHLAGISRVDEAENQPGHCWNTNVKGTRILLKTLNEQKKSPWVVFFSSREVYGNVTYLPVSEVSPVSPINHYGRSKLEAEKELEKFYSKGGKGVIVRLSNVYGIKNDFPERVIPKFVSRALSNKPLQLYEGDRILDFVHINDVCSMIWKIIQGLDKHPHTISEEIFNIGSGIGTTLSELAALIQKQTANRITVDECRCPKGHTKNFIANIEKGKTLLNWSSKIRLEEGLKELISQQ